MVIPNNENGRWQIGQDSVEFMTSKEICVRCHKEAKAPTGL